VASVSGAVNEKKTSDLLIGNAILICCLAAAAALVANGRATSDISRLIYTRIDLPAFWVVAAIAALSIVLYYVPGSGAFPAGIRLSWLKPWHIALATLVAIAAGVEPIYHGFPFSMDEYMTTFQAEIFAAGRLAGQVPTEWLDFGRALHHSFAKFDAASGQVYSGYRPGMAALYAAFDLARMGPYTSAVLSAGSVVLVASVARQIWPRSETAPLAAALLLATSQQVLVTGLTAYAMPGHLFFNLLWVRLFLIDRPWAHALAPLAGVAAAALHQIHVHAFFAAPFLLTLLRPLRSGLLVFYGTTYVLGHALIIGWDQIAVSSQNEAINASVGSIGRVTALFLLPGIFELSTVSALFARLIAWQNVALIPLIVIAVRRAEWPKPLRLLAASVAFSIVPYVFLMPDQGHGWGYRYLHGLIGNLALIATAGWLVVERMPELDRRRILRPLLAAGALSVIILLPLRAVQVERMVAPFARAYEHIRAIDADVVVVDSPAVYYGQDFVRNGPLLDNRPVLMDLRLMNEAQVRRLRAAYSVVLVSADDLDRFGLPRESAPVWPPPDWQQMRELLRD
jgi:hypothetical protein